MGLTQEQIYQFLQSAGGVGSVTLSNDGDDHATVTITARENSDEPALDSELLRALKEVVNDKSVSGKDIHIHFMLKRAPASHLFVFR